MIDSKLIKDMAGHFKSGNVAFVHIEVDEHNMETVVAGDPESMLWGLVGACNRLAQIFNCDFMTIIMNLNDRRRNGRVFNPDAGKGKVICGTDWQEEFMANERKELEKELSRRTRELEEEKRELKREVLKLNMKVTELNKKLSETKRERDAKILLQTKEIKALEHRIDEIIALKNQA